MKIAYIGSGYVGQVNAVGAAYYGHDVTLVDIDIHKIQSINEGHPTIYEHGLPELMGKMVFDSKSLRASIDVEKSVQEAEVIFIAVGTPDKQGGIDLTQIKEVAKNIGLAIKKSPHYHVIVVKSTVIPGTTLDVVKPIIEQYSQMKAGVDFGLAMNPEFLREGVALEDSLHPDSIVIGSEDTRSKEILSEVYSWAPEEAITYVGITAAEAIKYAKNSFLAMKITFANEWGNFCQNNGIDTLEVMEAIGKDKRISPMFLRNGPGYGGSCFPKDVNAIIHAGQEQKIPFRVLEEVVRVNAAQQLALVNLAQTVVGNLEGKTVGILGLSFKPNTDDVRESPALRIISTLNSFNCEIKAYCPEGVKMAKEFLTAEGVTDVDYKLTADEAVIGADLVIIPTDWAEFKHIIPKITAPTFIGHRTLIDPSKYNNVYCLGYPKK